MAETDVTWWLFLLISTAYMIRVHLNFDGHSHLIHLVN